MTTRCTPVWVLLAVLFALPLLGGIEPVEIGRWLLMFARWLWLLLAWSRKPRPGSR